MRTSLALRILLRSPAKTCTTFVLLTILSFLLLSRVNEYAYTAAEFKKVKEGYQGVGSVEVSPPVYTSIGSGEYLLGQYYNPDHPDGTWEDTRYKALTAEQIVAVSSLPHISSTDTRFLGAGVSEFLRVDDRASYYNYSGRSIFEATLLEDVFTEDFYSSESEMEQVIKEYGGWHISHQIEWKDAVIFSGHEPTTRFWDSRRVHHNAHFDNIGDEVLVYKEFYNQADGYMPFFPSRYDGNGFPLSFTRFSSPTILLSEDYLNILKPDERYVIVTRNYPSAPAPPVLGDVPSELWWPGVVSLKGQPDDYLETDEFSGLRLLIDITSQDNHTLDVVYTGDMTAIKRFNDGVMGIMEGRMLTADDTEACVISKNFAYINKLNIGDKLPLGLCDKLFEQHAGLGAVAVTRGRFSRPVKDVTLEIVGIYEDYDSEQTQGMNPFWSYNSNTVFVPKSLIPIDESALINQPIKPSAFSFVIDDAVDISAFLNECGPIIENMGLDLVFSDGGWLEIEDRFLETQRVSFISISMLLLATAATAVLAVYLFIGQRRHEYAIMRAMGCERQRAASALLLPLMVLCLASTLSGGVVALVWDRTNAQILIVLCCVFGELLFFFGAAAFGLWMIGEIPPLELLQDSNNGRAKNPAPTVNPAPEMFADETLTTNIHVPTIPQVRSYGALRHTCSYILRTVRRTPIRSLLAVCVSAAVVVATGRFAITRHTTRELFENFPVKAVFIGNLTPRYLEGFEESELVSDHYYQFVNASATASGNIGSMLISQTDPELFPDETRMVCAISAGLMQESGLDIGDLIELTVSYPNNRGTEDILTQSFEIIGQLGDEHPGNVAMIPPGAPLVGFYSRYTVYDMAEFTIADNDRIDDFISLADLRDLGDTSYSMNTDELDSIGENLRLIDALFPAAVAAIALIGALPPGLMILQSAKEAALITALGNSKRRAAMVLSARQYALYTIGFIIGALILLIEGYSVIPSVAATLLVCMVVNILCCAAAVTLGSIAVTRRNVLELLQTKE